MSTAGTMESRLELNSRALRAQDEHAQKLRAAEIQARARRIVVATDDSEVRITLRHLGHPITLFGEGAVERRDRLREVLAARQLDGLPTDISASVLKQTANSAKASSNTRSEMFYYPASDALKSTRSWIAEFSFKRATTRLAGLKRKRAEQDHKVADVDVALTVFS